MTDPIFKALEMRFNANATLVTTGRKLIQGFDEDNLTNLERPFTEVNIERTSAQLNTFGSDIDEWDLRFRYHAKDIRTLAAETWLGAMRAWYKDAGAVLSNYAFDCCGTREAAMSSPRNQNTAYDAAIRFLMTVQWRVRSPMTMGV